VGRSLFQSAVDAEVVRSWQACRVILLIPVLR
jgi:hypothetical protein